MKRIKSAARIADIVLGVFTALLAVCVIIYGAYMLLDNIYAGRDGFISRDLLVYRPDENSSSKESFEELQVINEDINAWITIYDTHIDYPIAQGTNDWEYINKNIYGQQSLTGSIYLSTTNDSGYRDRYNVIFGHHVINGSMFGDLDKYEDINYFLSHRDGVLQTPVGNYDLRVFAFLRTDAYDNMVYYLDSTRRDSIPLLMEYLSKNASNYIDLSSSDVKKVVALSTCDDFETNGRVIVFANATRRSLPPKSGEEEEEEAVPAFSTVGKLGHETDTEHWALLNLICVIATLLTLLPLFFTRRKYHQLRYAKDLIEEYEEPEDDEDSEENEESEDAEENKYQDLIDDLKHFINKMRTGILLEIIALIVSVIAFIRTEDMTKPIVIRDEWTWLMIFIFAVSLLVDVLFARYRGERPPEKEDEEV